MYFRIILLGLLVSRAISEVRLYNVYKVWGDHNYYGRGAEIKYENLESDEFHYFSKFSSDYLKVSFSSVPTLHPHWFNSSLRGLYLSNNNVSYILPKTFAGLIQLKELNLCKNNISKLDDGLFEELKNLRYLDLSYNNISSIHQNIFKNLTSLTGLYLQYNKFSTLHSNIFEDLTSLVSLDISHNNIEGLTNDYFKGLDHLSDIHLNNNKITSMDNNLFEHQGKSLKILNISSNSLTMMNFTICGLSNLTHLDLSNNRIESIKDYSFKNLTSLKLLKLDYNTLHSVPKNAFPDSYNLAEIYLQDNYMTGINKDAFVAQKDSLKTLNLSTNFLFSPIIPDMPALTNLYLSQNILSRIEEETFKNLTSLTVLDLSMNKIETISQHAFSRLKKLEYVYLQNNFLSTLHNKLFHSQKESLRVVNLTSNRLRELNTAFKEKIHLKSLLVRYNNISKLTHDDFGYLVRLEELDLSHNQLNDYDFKFGLFDYMDNLRYLNFSYNNFVKFPLLHLNPLENLRELFFGNNKIISIDTKTMLQHFHNLRKVNIDGVFEWSCEKLAKSVREFQNGDVEVIVDKYFDTENVRGMKCRRDNLEDGSINNNTEIIEKLIEQLKNREIKPKSKEVRLLKNQTDNSSVSGFVMTILVVNTIALSLVIFAIFALFVIVYKKINKKSVAEDQLELL